MGGAELRRNGLAPCVAGWQVNGMSDHRVLPLKAVHNFRDYGHYPASGGRLRGGLLYRSAQHADATPDDLARIGALELATVIDLRGNHERRRQPCRRPEGFAAEVIIHDGETAGMPPHLQAELANMDEAGMRRATAEIYRSLPLRKGLLEVFGRYFEALTLRDGPSLVHCLAGKDRTGIAVALLHRTLGVHHDDMMADYLLTNSAGDQDARISAAASSVRARYGNLSDAALRVIMGVAPEYLDNAFDAITAKYGSLESFMEAELGVDAARREMLRQKFVV